MKKDTPFWVWFDTVEPFLTNRKECYEKTFRYLDSLERPVTIIETGCMRRDPLEPGSWTGDGCSTLLFDKYVQHRGGQIYSVDIEPEHVEACRSFVSDHVDVHLGDSVARLAELAVAGVKPDLVFLDSFDRVAFQPFETALHAAKEFHAILPAITDETLVVVDDTPSMFVKEGGQEPTIDVCGKGAFVWLHAKNVGAETLFSRYQVGWTHMIGPRWVDGGYDKKHLTRTGGFTDLDGDITKLINRAREYVETDRTADAERAYRAVMVHTKPPQSGMQRVARGEACAFYARISSSVGMYGTATDWYRDAIISDPRCVEYRLEMIRKGFAPMLNYQLAKQEAERCVLIDPDNPEVWRTLGEVETSLCNAPGARAAFERQLALIPDDPHAMLDLCVMTLDMADYDETRRLADRIMETDRRADGIHVMAMIANREGRHEDAVKLFDEALVAGCNNTSITHWNKSLSLLAVGRYREGWREQEWRKHELRNPAMSLGFQRFSRPLWEGQPAEVDDDGGKRKAILLIHAEAGMGDNIVYSRFLREFTAKGFDVRYEAHVEMLHLMQRSFPDIEVVPRAPDYPGSIGLANFDYHLPLGTLPHALGIDYDTVPAYTSYLVPDRELVARYRQVVRKKSRGDRVGFCWSSGIRDYGIWIKEYGKRKSMHFDAIEPAVEAVRAIGGLAVNLQVGPERAQHGGRVFEALPAKPNWDDTAALVANLDLVITVDTAVAHLAGALGIPTWLIMQQDGASFHFMTERPGAPWNEASPWYPSVRIFRQCSPGDWSGVIRRVENELRQAGE